MRHVGSVLTCRAMGVYFFESDLLGNTGGHGREAPSQYGRSRERKAAESADCFAPGASETRAFAA